MWSGRARKSLTGVLIGVGAAHARLLSIAGFLDGPPSAVARCRLASHNWFFKRSQRRPCAYTHTAPLSLSSLRFGVSPLSSFLFFFFFTVLSYNRRTRVTPLLYSGTVGSLRKSGPHLRLPPRTRSILDAILEIGRVFAQFSLLPSLFAFFPVSWEDAEDSGLDSRGWWLVAS